MSGLSDVRTRERSTFEDALARFDIEVGRCQPRQVSLDEIVSVVRADRSAAHD